ncbi:MAG: helix-turn-helix domain-containing protein [Desulfosalsimonas sp.]
MSFGRYLKAIRENRGVSLEELSGRICVPIGQLQLIEAEDFAGMPEDVYAKGILRAYAHAVGVDPEDIIQQFKTDSKAHAKALRREKEIFGSGKTNLLRMGLALGALAMVMVITLYVASLASNAHEPADTQLNKAETGRNETEAKTSPIKTDNAETELLNSSDWAIAADSELQVLSVNAVSETTINISVDGRDPTKYKLAPKDYLELAARNSFLISINDPASVLVNFNGEPVDIAGEPGQQTEIILSEKPEGRK